jgi:hypothetical protein
MQEDRGSAPADGASSGGVDAGAAPAAAAAPPAAAASPDLGWLSAQLQAVVSSK